MPRAAGEFVPGLMPQQLGHGFGPHRSFSSSTTLDMSMLARIDSRPSLASPSPVQPRALLSSPTMQKCTDLSLSLYIYIYMIQYVYIRID